MKIILQSIALALFVVAGFLVAHGPGKSLSGEAVYEEQGRSGARQALEFWTRARAYPHADIPPDRYFKAVMQVKSSMKHLPREIQSTNSWQSIGPSNLSGRMISVSVNPQNSNTLYAGAASGGLWRSYTDGLEGDWQRINTGFPVLGVGAIAIQPNDSNTIYIGTGEVYQYEAAVGGLIIRTTRGSYGVGILKSTDGGKTWTKSLDWTLDNQRGIQCITFNPLNYNTLLAATSEGIFKSTNAGSSWYQTLNVVMAENILINPQDTGVAVASVGNFDSYLGGLYYSFDTGENWIGSTPFPSASGKTMLEMYQADPNVLYASVAESTTSVSSLWRSTDFGFTWSNLSNFDVAGVQGWYSHYVAVHPLDSSQVIRGGVNIYKSMNGGRSQFSASGSYSDHHAYAHDPANPDVIYDANDDGIYRSTDFGETYTYVSNNLQTGQFYNGFSNSSQDSLLAIGQVQDHIPGYIYRGSTLWGRSAADECGWTATDPTNDQYMYCVDRNGGNIYKSANHGNSFSYVFGTSEFGAWNTPLVLAPSNPNVIYEGRNIVYKSTNGGFSWLPTSSSVIGDGNVALSMAVSFTGQDTLYVGKAPYITGLRAKIFRTFNGGASWADVSSGLPDAYPLDIAVDPDNSQIVYAGFGGFGIDHLFKSTNAGTSWADIGTTLPDIPVTAVVVDPQNSNYIYIGTDVGVHVSTDGGSTWSDFSEGLPDAVLVSDLVVSPSNRTLRVVTHGNGVFERKMPALLPYLILSSPNGGEQWSALAAHQISWDEAAIPLARLEYSTDNGTTWGLIADSVNGFTRSYTWHVPFLQTTQARIKVTAVGSPAVYSESQNPFSITFRGGVITVTSGWNMISIPSAPYDRIISHIFTHAASTLFDYTPNMGYTSYWGPSEVDTGKGYWIRYSTGETIPIAGDSLVSLQIPLTSGWNMIGALTSPIATSSLTSTPPGIFAPTFFTYEGGYVITDSLLPGAGYWVRSSAAGLLQLSASPATAGTLAHSGNPGQQWNTLKASDAGSHAATLDFGSGDVPADLTPYELPPFPPDGEFDVRFAGGYFAAFSPSAGQSRDLAIELRGVHYPLTLKPALVQPGRWSMFADGVRYGLTDGCPVAIASPIRTLSLRYEGMDVHPASFALHQNFPNPFNPSTTLQFDLPEKSHVTIRIYSAIGQIVATLVDGTVEAGAGSVSWNASDMPSGVYLAKLTAGSFTESRKMLLIR